MPLISQLFDIKRTIFTGAGTGWWIFAMGRLRGRRSLVRHRARSACSEKTRAARAKWVRPLGATMVRTPPKSDLILQLFDTETCSTTNFVGAGIEGMWVDQGCRGEFLCNGKNTTCACIGSQGWCSHRHNCSCNQLACHSTAKNVTVIALDGNGAAVGRHTLLASGTAVKLELVIDVPSISTGTGTLNQFFGLF